MIEDTNPHPETHTLAMSAADFVHFGENRFAYLKPVVINSENLIGVYGADGQELALFEEWEMAEATVRQNNMVPLSVH